MGAAGEDVEDQLAAVDDLDFGDGGDGAHLRRGQLLVENQQGRPLLQGADHHLLELPLPHQSTRVELAWPLHDPVEHHHVGGTGQLRQFVEGIVGLLARCLGHRNQDGPLSSCHPDRSLRRPCLLEFRIERTDETAVDRESSIVHRRAAERISDHPAVRIRGNQVGVVHRSGEAVAADRHRHHQVEAQQRQVGQVILGERFPLEVGVHAAQSAQTAAAESMSR